MAVALISWLWIGPAAPAIGEGVEFVERPDDEFLILALEINGTLREDGVEAWLPLEAGPSGVLVPLGAISRAMSYVIEANPGDGLAEGWFQREARLFQLDLLAKSVIVDGNRFALPSGGAEAHVDDIYVRAELLSAWFELEITLDLSSLILSVSSEGALPFQERQERQARYRRLGRRFAHDEIDPETVVFLPYSTASRPALLLSQSIGASISPDARRYQGSYNLQGNMDLLGSGAALNLSYEVDSEGAPRIGAARASLQRRDPRRRLLGPLEAGKVTLGDVAFTPVPLLIGSQSGAGAAVSSDPALGFRFAGDTTDFLIEGDAPPDWDAELYRNGNFIDFQRVGADGRFRFAEVTLIDGYNLFTVRILGPEGQRRTITREVYRGANMLKPNETVYDFALGMPEADFLPLAEDYRDDRRLGFGGQVHHGVSDFLTLGGSFYAGPEGEEEAQAATVTVSAAYLSLNTGAQILFANGGRHAIELSARAVPFGVNAALIHTVYGGFAADEEAREEETSLSLSRGFGFFNNALAARRRRFRDGRSDILLEDSLSTNLLGVSITKEVRKTFDEKSEPGDFDGNFAAAGTIGRIRLRGELSYDFDPTLDDRLRDFRFNAQREFGDNGSLRLGGGYSFPTGNIALDLRYSRDFGPFALDFTVGGTNRDTYSFGLGIRTGLQPAADGFYNLVNPTRANQASLGVRAFVDRNQNGRHDPEAEEPIAGVTFRGSRANAKAITGESGVAWLNGLEEAPTRITVDKQAIPDIYLVPAREALDLIPRRGAGAVIDFPFRRIGEIDGFVMALGAGGAETDAPIADVPVRLINPESGAELERTRSEYDGYFVFSAIRLGRYEVQASTGWFDRGNGDTVSRTIEITNDEPLALDVVLALPIKEETDPPEEAGAPGLEP